MFRTSVKCACTETPYATAIASGTVTSFVTSTEADVTSEHTASENVALAKTAPSARSRTVRLKSSHAIPEMDIAVVTTGTRLGRGVGAGVGEDVVGEGLGGARCRRRSGEEERYRSHVGMIAVGSVVGDGFSRETRQQSLNAASSSLDKTPRCDRRWRQRGRIVVVSVPPAVVSVRRRIGRRRDWRLIRDRCRDQRQGRRGRQA